MHNIADEITSKVAKIKNFFSLNETKNISYRIDSLKRLKKIIKLKEEEIFDALNEDLEKSNFESYITEISLVLKEIDYHIVILKDGQNLRNGDFRSSCFLHAEKLLRSLTALS